MSARMLKINEGDEDKIAEAAQVLRAGGLVAVPTETVYGLAANGLDAQAVERIYEAKGRPAHKPVSLLVGGPEDIPPYCRDIPACAYRLAEAFWPGPLTIVLKKNGCVPPAVTAGGDTVGLRCPDHPVTLAIIRAAKLPLAAPSANLSGGESPKDAETVMRTLGGRIDLVVDGGAARLGRESTVVDLTCDPPKILRRGALETGRLRDILGEALI